MGRKGSELALLWTIEAGSISSFRCSPIFSRRFYISFGLRILYLFSSKRYLETDTITLSPRNTRQGNLTVYMARQYATDA